MTGHLLNISYIRFISAGHAVRIEFTSISRLASLPLIYDKPVFCQYIHCLSVSIKERIIDLSKPNYPWTGFDKEAATTQFIFKKKMKMQTNAFKTLRISTC